MDHTICPFRCTGISFDLLEDVFDAGAFQVVGQRVDLIQRGSDGQAAQQFLGVHLVHVNGQFGDPLLSVLTETR